MNKTELTLFNLGESLDNIANVDPRGYGVCKVLYKSSREFTGKPLCLNAAEKLIKSLNKNDTVFILTGFVLHPYCKAETDGAIGSVLLANALAKGIGTKCVVVCPDEAKQGVDAIIDYLDADIEVCVFTKNISDAIVDSDLIISKYNPKAVISIECPGADKDGRYHNSKGYDVTDLQAKQDFIFNKLKDDNVLNIAIGDLGNEIGMNSISDCLENEIPVIPVKSKSDNIITATVSDWGCYSLIAMLSFMQNNQNLMHDSLIQKEIMNVACNNGLIDMNGEHIPAIDGFDAEITSVIVQLMKELVYNTIKHNDSCDYWFDKMIEIKG